MGLTLEDLSRRFGDAVRQSRYLPNPDGRLTVEVAGESAHDVIEWLRDEAEPRFALIASLTATDESLPEDSEPGKTALRKGAQRRYRVVYHVRALGAEPVAVE